MVIKNAKKDFSLNPPKKRVQRGFKKRNPPKKRGFKREGSKEKRFFIKPLPKGRVQKRNPQKKRGFKTKGVQKQRVQKQRV
ncbi:hypothetical protein [Helicobacter pylori]|uniref:hypothetical protein n=1 Tax=Helicobacter pylori TaxID=210 RepID=UPI002648C132|nr:hypothetical protein [Helicobacter pylori]MCQ2941032.1 hypothetical protein [Helicobacter pylori]